MLKGVTARSPNMQARMKMYLGMEWSNMLGNVRKKSLRHALLLKRLPVTGIVRDW